MERQAWMHRIVIDPAIHHGEPCIKNTRVPVSMIVGSIADGDTAKDILAFLIPVNCRARDAGVMSRVSKNAVFGLNLWLLSELSLPAFLTALPETFAPASLCWRYPRPR